MSPGGSHFMNFRNFYVIFYNFDWLYWLNRGSSIFKWLCHKLGVGENVYVRGSGWWWCWGWGCSAKRVTVFDAFGLIFPPTSDP